MLKAIQKTLGTFFLVRYGNESVSAAVVPDLTTMTLPPLAVKTAATPFSLEWVTLTLTKQAHLQLVSEAHHWRSAHERAVARACWVTLRHQHAIERAQLRDLRQRVFNAKTDQSRFMLRTGQTRPWRPVANSEADPRPWSNPIAPRGDARRRHCPGGGVSELRPGVRPVPWRGGMRSR